ncbi:hypothetical protein HRG_002250 [Hirsutella rhossiliensis]|uniref:Uncharacterized protein n=1 Tax=Hirsutella rhossiliensis TaxID=111463 RepID=A0A9P8SLD3_9HYPO|nr:uncharacterized protein HRG_02250 [Hirsutella rhossiliensis]KAH0966841.1 hypothetical protein HRG_02250 [Hirsutella rhossiliensis]
MVDRMPVPTGPGEPMNRKLIRTLGYLQVAQLVTSVVKSTVTHLRDNVPEEQNQRGFLGLLQSGGTLLQSIANDTVPGYADILQHIDDLKGRLRTLELESPLEALKEGFTAMQEFEANVTVTIFENYMPGVPEILDNWQRGKQELAEDHGPETEVQQAMRILRVLGSRATNTLNDVLRDWIPGYKEAQDSISIHTKNLANEVQLYQERKTDIFQVLKDGLELPLDIALGTLHRMLSDYVPGETYLEGAVFGTKPAANEYELARKFLDRICLESKPGALPWYEISEAFADWVDFKCAWRNNPEKLFLEFYERRRRRQRRVSPPSPSDDKITVAVTCWRDGRNQMRCTSSSPNSRGNSHTARPFGGD